MAKKQSRQAEPTAPKAPDNVWELPDGHHLGKIYGFTKKGNEIYLAPGLVEPMQTLRNDRAALDDFITATNRHVHEQLRAFRRREDQWWDQIARELGVSREDAGLSYFYQGYLRRKEPPLDAAVDAKESA